MSGIFDITNGQCSSTITVDGGPVRCSLAIEHDGWAHQNGATLWPASSPHPSTREQIAEAIDPQELWEAVNTAMPEQFEVEDVDAVRDVVLALIQNGAGR